MNEYISRQAAIEIVDEAYREQLRMGNYAGDTVAYNIASKIKNIPALTEKWISADERLPERDMNVLTSYIGIETGMRFYQVLMYYATDDEPHFQHMNHNESLKVTHWMPIPNMPKE